MTETTAPNAAQRVEDMAFENRVKTLTAEHRWDELRFTFLLYGSALLDREAPYE